MVYTLTISPSLDFYNYVDEFKANEINRSKESFYLPGGKGINVSLVLKELGMDTVCLGFNAGFTGEYLVQLLNEKNIKTDFINALGKTRINVKIVSEHETAINTDTLIINDDHINNLKYKLNKLQDNDVLIISGKIPNILKQTLYEDLIALINKKNIKIIVDAEKDLLLNTLKYKPFLIKPNRDELEQIFNIKIKNKEDAIFYAKKLQEKGALNVIVSLDKDGAVMVDSSNNDYYLQNSNQKVVNSVGAGDSVIAGVIYGLENNYSMKDAFLLGMACGNATASSKNLADKTSIIKTLELLKEINN